MTWVTEHQELLDIVNNNGVVIVDFTAPSWCRPCQQFMPHFDKASEMSAAKFVAVDVDKAPWAMEEYGVQSVPTVVKIDDEDVTVLKERTVVKLLAEI